MADEKTTLPEIHSYRDLDDEMRAKVDQLLGEYCTSPVAKQAMVEGLNEFGSEVALLISQVGSSEKMGHLKEGIWGPLMNLMQKGGKTTVKGKRRPTRLAAAKPSRGKLPFTKLPAPRETREVFSARWLREGRRYAVEMINWTTGEINWLAGEVYNHKKGSIEWYVYLVLVTGPRTYPELIEMMLDEAGKPFPQKEVDWALQCFMVEPSWLPPGAGVYREDPASGQMRIEREPLKALQETSPFAGSI